MEKIIHCYYQGSKTSIAIKYNSPDSIRKTVSLLCGIEIGKLVSIKFPNGVNCNIDELHYNKFVEGLNYEIICKKNSITSKFFIFLCFS